MKPAEVGTVVAGGVVVVVVTVPVVDINVSVSVTCGIVRFTSECEVVEKSNRVRYRRGFGLGGCDRLRRSRGFKDSGLQHQYCCVTIDQDHLRSLSLS